jgi:hypothetical protein
MQQQQEQRAENRNWHSESTSPFPESFFETDAVSGDLL